MVALDKIREQFTISGYIELPQNKSPKTLLWQPDLLFSKDNYIYLVLVKSNNSVPPTYLTRIANIPKGNIIPLIVFARKLTTTDEKVILSLGISIGYFTRGKLSNFNIKKKLPQKIVQKEINKKLEVIDMFISSKQDIDERKFIAERVEFLRKSNSYPFAPPRLIEYDRFKINNLYKHIDDVMSHCEWIIILLEDSYSKVTYYEIKKALSILNYNNIFIFVKETRKCKDTWKNALDKLKKINSIKYLPYSDQSDLEVSLTKAIRNRMNEICKRRKVEIYV